METIADIKKTMTDAFMSNGILQTMYQIDASQSFESQFSELSLESIVFDIVAFCIWVYMQIVSISISQQNAFILQQKIHSLSWYSAYAKLFQYGDALPWGEVTYDNTGVSDDDITAAQVVKFAAATKVPGGIRIKVAGLENGELTQIPNPQFLSFQEYMFRISAAGDNLFYTNNAPDSLKLTLKIWYDALVLNSEGKRLDGTNDTPVQDAIDAYIKGIDFDGGRFVPASLTDALQSVEGIKVPEIELCQTQYAALPYVDVPGNGVVPDAGWVRIINSGDLQLTFTAWQA